MKLNISGPQNSTVMENLSFKREEPNKRLSGSQNFVPKFINQSSLTYQLNNDLVLNSWSVQLIIIVFVCLDTDMDLLDGTSSKSIDTLVEF